MWRSLLLGAAACVHLRSSAVGGGSRRRVDWRVLGCLVVGGSCRWKVLPKEGRLEAVVVVDDDAFFLGGFDVEAALMQLYCCSVLRLLSAIIF